MLQEEDLMREVAAAETGLILPTGPTGRRRLAALLSAAGREPIRVNGHVVTRQEAIAHMMWNLVLQGEVSFPDGRLMFIEDANEWLQVAKFLYTHVDGPVVSAQDHKSANTVIRVVFQDDPEPAEVATE